MSCNHCSSWEHRLPVPRSHFIQRCSIHPVCTLWSWYTSTKTINLPGSMKVCTSLCKHCTMSTLHYVCHALCLHCIMSTLHFLGKLDVHLQLKLHSNVRLAQNIDTLDLCNCGWSTLLPSIHCTPWASFISTICRQIAISILAVILPDIRWGYSRSSGYWHLNIHLPNVTM